MVRTKKYRLLAVVRPCQFELLNSFPFFSGTAMSKAARIEQSSVFVRCALYHLHSLPVQIDVARITKQYLEY